MKWMSSYLGERKQSVIIKGKISKLQDVTLGTPQGSRLSPLLFICLMADLDLHVSEGCSLSQFADDTQSLCVAKTKEEVLKTTKEEADNVINYFSANDLCNNSDKAAILYNSKGKGQTISLEIGGKELKSKQSEKLLGLYISSDFNWKVHCEKLASQLNKKVAF